MKKIIVVILLLMAFPCRAEETDSVNLKGTWHYGIWSNYYDLKDKIIEFKNPDGDWEFKEDGTVMDEYGLVGVYYTFGKIVIIMGMPLGYVFAGELNESKDEITGGWIIVYLIPGVYPKSMGGWHAIKED